MNTPVNFKLAKLLKEKGINIYSEHRYTDFNGIERLEKDASEIFPYAPTIAEVIMWLYEKYGIWIGVQPTSFVGKFQFRTYWNNNNVMNQHWNDSMSKVFNSPTEAYEAAIDYTLNHLI